MTNYLLSYDISHDRLRVHIAHLLAREGCIRLQKSVFLAPKFQAKELKQLKNKLEQLIKTRQESSPNDSILCIPISPKQLKKVYWVGQSDSIDKVQDSIRHLLV